MRALEIHHNCDVLSEIFGNFAQIFDDIGMPLERREWSVRQRLFFSQQNSEAKTRELETRFVDTYFVFAMRKVESSNIHSGRYELREHLLRLNGRTECAGDLRLDHTVLESDRLLF